MVSGRRQVIWSYEDEALLHTAIVLHAVLTNADVPTIPAHFAMVGAEEGELLVASGPYSQQWFGAVGDGTYTSSTYAFGGPLTMAATLGVSAIGNAGRRRRARYAATPKWHTLDDGVLHVSTLSMYFEGQEGWRPWTFDGIDTAQMLARCAIEHSGRSDSGEACRLQTRSPWAELAFALWAIRRGVRHPHLPFLFPQDWRDRAQALGIAPPQVDFT